MVILHRTASDATPVRLELRASEKGHEGTLPMNGFVQILIDCDVLPETPCSSMADITLRRADSSIVHQQAVKSGAEQPIRGYQALGSAIDLAAVRALGVSPGGTIEVRVTLAERVFQIVLQLEAS